MFDHLNPDEVPYFSLKGFRTKAKVVKVYDGDSITLLFPYFNKYYRFRCRIYGIDTPELRTKDLKEKRLAIEVRDYLRDLIFNQTIDVECFDFDKYGRVLVKLAYRGEDIGTMLCRKKFAYIYHGKTKKKHWFLKMFSKSKNK